MEQEAPKNETTNAVLKVSIDGLAKLTDTQLGYVNETLKDLKSLMSGFATKAELEEAKKDFNNSIKRIEEGFANHNKDDIASFGKIDKKQDKLQNIVLLGMGGLAVIVFFIQFILPHFWK